MDFWELMLAETTREPPLSVEYSDRQSEPVSGSHHRGGRRRGEGKSYLIDHTLESGYLTRREAECMVQLLYGKTIAGTAEELGLSPRTVEYYLGNMRAKLRCRSKAELIHKVMLTNFLSTVDF